MAQHDFVPAWLNFSTPQSTKVTVTDHLLSWLWEYTLAPVLLGT